MKINWGSIVGYAIAFMVTLLFFYSLTIGPRKLKVQHIDLTFHDLPESFEGYKIVQFSDAHIGTFNEVMDYTLKRDMDSIIAQNPDMVCFTGDLQNMEPTEIDKQKMQLSRLAALGIPVYSVLGNHDYSVYIKAPQTVKVKNEKLLQLQERDLGWTLLKNQNRKIYSRDKSQYFVLAGEENGGDGKNAHSPAKANLKKTLSGTKPNDFIVMLQHDPKAWEEDILPHSHVQLTLSGHTHGGQIGVLGLRPTLFSYKQDYGLYEKDGRYLYVSGGLGGVIPIRFGITPEIVVITLHRK
jgi:predicted MPP superfamily phosphohydrolase